MAQIHDAMVTGVQNSDTALVTVPVVEQRDQDISIDDVVEVTIAGLDGPFNSISFENPQISGDMVSVPAEIVRKAEIEPGEYEISFEKVEDDVDEVQDESEEEEEESTSLEEQLQELERGVENGMDAVEDDETPESIGELFSG